MAQPEELKEIATIDGVIRISGLIADLDLFYRPNGLECADFDAVWQRASAWAEEVRVVDPLDLIVTKDGTGGSRTDWTLPFWRPSSAPISVRVW